MTVYLAAVKYPLGAERDEKVAALRDGLGEVAAELVTLGCSLTQIEGWLEEAMSCAEEEHAALVDE